jgi:transcriptional regulator with XRE-family HTH domain
MDANKIGKQIANLRKERGYTQEALAEKLNISPQAVSKWENGHALPETALLPLLAKTLETSIDALFTDSGIQILSALSYPNITAKSMTFSLPFCNFIAANDSLRLRMYSDSGKSAI